MTHLNQCFYRNSTLCARLAFVGLLWVTSAALAQPVVGTAAKGEAKAKQKTETQAAGASHKKKQSKTRASAPTQLSVRTDKPGYTVELDGEVIGKTPLPGAWTLAPGAHKVVFKTGAKITGSTKVNASPGRLTEVTWPLELGDEEGDGGSSFRWRKWSMSDIGAATAAGGLVSIGVGAFFGTRALSIAEEASSKEIRSTYRRDFGRLSDQAEDMAFAANIAFGVGAAALLSGLSLALFGDGGLIALHGNESESSITINGDF
ncbi:MAG: PEGA domain-containing protein [Bradymonadia bacterium]